VKSGRTEEKKGGNRQTLCASAKKRNICRKRAKSSGEVTKGMARHRGPKIDLANPTSQKKEVCLACTDPTAEKDLVFDLEFSLGGGCPRQRVGSNEICIEDDEGSPRKPSRSQGEKVLLKGRAKRCHPYATEEGKNMSEESSPPL